jgi:hypothetical protein
VATKKFNAIHCIKMSLEDKIIFNIEVHHTSINSTCLILRAKIFSSAAALQQTGNTENFQSVSHMLALHTVKTSSTCGRTKVNVRTKIEMVFSNLSTIFPAAYTFFQ